MSDGSGKSRPRPKYGEYATPQEQAEVVAKSMPPVSPLLVSRSEPVPAPGARGEPENPTGKPASRAASSAASASAKPQRRRWDLILSVALLAYGLFSVLAAFAQYSDIPALVNQVYETQSIGTFTPTDLSAGAGIVIILATVVLYALTAWLTVRRLMMGRIAFWLPVAGGVAAGIITLSVIGVVLASDSAFIDYVEAMTPGT